MQNEDYEAMLEIMTNLCTGIDKVANQLEYCNKAIRYHADCIGTAGDNVNPGTVKLLTEADIPDDDQLISPKTKSHTLDQVKEVMNDYAHKYGKDAAFALVKKYAGSTDITKLKKEDYAKIIKEAS